ncbi:hypothetical protein KC331_g7042 [Hortaea werneckii]|uniref:EthD domain-containing protein n=1 Tax=Hortaea werneckii TaxID=91943 RepID=A0A3M7BY94_HORWE|nr:hypothetical protein KC331_g7042 [Hortaea werneckii]KAI7700957.1 hypothetical protein KC353_g15589 [Hortaea werneckii]RMY44825.1 hypothetical protein D0865_10305 [Hortaea werneckii]
MATISVLYPAGTKFDLDYYMATHMPLVMNKWSSYGLKSWKVVKMPFDQAFCVMALLEWGSMGEFQKAGEGPEIKDIMADVNNFSDKQPTFLTGELVGQS